LPSPEFALIERAEAGLICSSLSDTVPDPELAWMA
jgi:hypothetical protein